jgi:hypothetical protein
MSLSGDASTAKVIVAHKCRRLSLFLGARQHKGFIEIINQGSQSVSVRDQI